MAFIPPTEVTRLKSFAEVISWVVGAYAPMTGQGSLDEVSRIRDVRNKKTVHLSRGQMDYAEPDGTSVPGHLHVAWFLRIGAFDTRDLNQISERSKSGQAKLFNSLAVGAKDYFDDESFYHFDYLKRGVPIPEHVARWVEAEAPQAGKTKRHNGKLLFSPTRVQAAIDVIRKSEPAEAQSSTDEPDPAPDTRNASRAASLAPASQAAGVCLVHQRRRAHARLERARLVLATSGSPLQGALVATDASVLGFAEGATMRVARVNRVSGSSAQWADRLELSQIGNGRVLAIAGTAGADVLFVWAGDSGTAIYRGRQSDGSVDLVAFLDGEPAAAAVLHGARALLSFRNDDSNGWSCDAFRDLIVTSVVGAASNGRLVVLASGAGHDGQDAAWIEVDGRYRQQVPADTRLELLLGTRSSPRLRGVNGVAIHLSPQQTTRAPYEHWLSPLLVGEAGTS